jgi:MOSC domain-containing protein YiiM
MHQRPEDGPVVIAVNRSGGGIPKLPQPYVRVTEAGLDGDAHAHAKHNRPDRAVCLWDMEILRQLTAEGFALCPGTAGENLTVEGLHVQRLPPGTRLEIGDVVLQLTQPRKPCYVLDAIDPRLQEAVIGRLGYMAAVVQGGTLAPGMHVRVRVNGMGTPA